MSNQVWNVVELQHGDYSCKILSSYGASLISYRHKDVEFVEGYSNPKEIIEQKYKGVILAPFPNRLAKAKYSFEGKNYQLPINREKEGLALHGLLYDQIFEVEFQEKKEVMLSKKYSGNEGGYPFPFTINVRYILQKDGALLITTEVEAKEKNMPFGLGWHPYFKIGESIDKLKCEFPQSNQIVLDESKLPTGENVSFNKNGNPIALQEYNFDDCFKLLSANKASFKLISEFYSLEVKGKSIDDFPFFQIYTPPNRSSIAIEPMTCAPDAFNNKKGLQVLKSKQKRSYTYIVKADYLG